MNGDNIIHKTKRSLYWGIGNQLARQIFSIATTILLVRLLTPRDIGLMALVLIFSDLSNIIINLGYNTAIIQDDKIDQQGIHSIFWLNTITGISLMLLLIFFAPSLAIFFEEPALKLLFIGMSTVYFLFSLELVPKALLEKSLDYKSITIAESTATVISSVVAIILAYMGAGVWALIWQLITNTFLTVILLWKFAKWKPIFTFSWYHIRRTGKFSRSIFYSHILQMTKKSLDRFLLGKYSSKSTLGLYDKGESFASIPQRNASGILLSVVLSAFAKHKNHPEVLKKYYLQIMKYIVLVNYPIMIGLFVIADIFVYTLFGEQWMGMVPFLRIFAIVMFFSSFNSLLGSLFLARGMSKMVIKDTTIREGLLVIAILIGFNWGALGMAYAIAIARFFNFLLTLHHGREVAFVSVKNQLQNIKPFFIASCIMGCSLFLINSTILNHTAPYLTLFLDVTVGATVYIGLLQAQHDNTIRELIKFL